VVVNEKDFLLDGIGLDLLLLLLLLLLLTAGLRPNFHVANVAVVVRERYLELVCWKELVFFVTTSVSIRELKEVIGACQTR
jgi:hypothetical protein